MYLFTFIFLLITILGLFTHVYALQSARIMGKQTVAAQQMMAWHYGAVTAAKDAANIAFLPAHPEGCRLSPATTKYTGYPGFTVLGTACPTKIQDIHLPYNYSIGTLPWETITFKSGSSQYVVTFVPPLADGSAPLQPVGVTGSDLLRQLLRVDSQTPSIGTVTGTDCASRLMTPTTQPSSAVTLSYPVPKLLPTCYIPVGSVAIYTQLN